MVLKVLIMQVQARFLRSLLTMEREKMRRSGFRCKNHPLIHKLDSIAFMIFFAISEALSVL